MRVVSGGGVARVKDKSRARLNNNESLPQTQTFRRAVETHLSSRSDVTVNDEWLINLFSIS